MRNAYKNLVRKPQRKRPCGWIITKQIFEHYGELWTELTRNMANSGMMLTW